MAYVHPDADVRAAGHAASERLERWAVDLPFDPAVAAAVTELAATPEAAALDRRAGPAARVHRPRHPQRRPRAVARGARGGAGGDGPAGRDRRALQPAHRRGQRRAWSSTEDDLEGLPDEYRAGLARDDDGRYRITMAYPDVVPFLENARRRDRRQELTRLFNNRAADTNRALLAEAVALRERVAELFGRPSWAHHTMDEKMAHDPETVDGFYDDLVPALTKKATGEIAVMAARLAADEAGDDDLQSWDLRYYDTQLRRTEYGVDGHEVAAYFPLEQVLDGLLDDHRRGVRRPLRAAARRAGVAPRRPQLRHRRPGDRRAGSPSSTWTSTRARASSATPPRSRSCPAGACPTARTARRCRRSSPTSRSRPPSARRCCCTTRSSRSSTSSATSSTRR